MYIYVEYSILTETSLYSACQALGGIIPLCIQLNNKCLLLNAAFLLRSYLVLQIFGNSAAGANVLSDKVSYGLSSNQEHSTALSDAHILMLKWTV